MSFHLSLFLLQLLVRRRSRIDPAISGNTGRYIINTIIINWFLVYKIQKTLDYLIKGCLLLGGLGVRGGLRSAHVQASGHIWDLSLNEVNGKVTVAFRLHWLLLKGLEHLLKLMKQKK